MISGTIRRTVCFAVFPLAVFHLVTPVPGFAGSDSPITIAENKSPTPDVAEENFWKLLKGSDNPEAFRSYLELYPDGVFAEEARRQLRRLKPGGENRHETLEANGTSEGAHDCDRFAADPYDPDRAGEGTYWNQIEIAKARMACEAAVREFPEEPRFRYQLGLVHHAGLSTAKAFDHYLAAAKAGSGPAHYSLALLYKQGCRNLKGMDDNLYVRLLKFASDKNYAPAMTSMGYSHQSGKGVEKNPADSIDLFQRAADLGDPNAMGALASAYQNGTTVRKDTQRAKSWEKKQMQTLQSEAEGGNAFAAEQLARAYQEGRLVPPDTAKQEHWAGIMIEGMSTAAENGQSWLATSLGLSHEYGGSVEQDLVAAAKWYRLGAKGGDAFAMEKLADFYKNGSGIKRDENKSQNWRIRAAEKYFHESKNGNPVSMEHLNRLLGDNIHIRKYFDEKEIILMDANIICSNWKIQILEIL